jgi:hypothetical protein
MKVRSMVGLIPLFAVSTLPAGGERTLPGVREADEVVHHEPPGGGADHIASFDLPGAGERRLCCAVTRERATRAGARARARRGRSSSPLMACGHSPRRTRIIRSSCTSAARPTEVDYEPAESSQRPVRRQLQLARPGLDAGELPAHRGAAEATTTTTATRIPGRVPHRLGEVHELGEVANELSRRLVRLFTRGRRPTRRCWLEPEAGRTTRISRLRAVLRILPRRQRCAAWAPRTRPGGRPWSQAAAPATAGMADAAGSAPTCMSTTKHYDVIIIGSGAGGGTLARQLAPSGKRILILERGGYLPREKQNWDTHGGVRRTIATYPRTSGTTRTGSRSSQASTTSSAVRPRCTAQPSSACASRTSPLAPHADGMTPDWPIRYDDLEPYYTRAERLYQVHGQRGDDPTDPPASAPYPFPAVSHEPRISQEWSDGLKRAGYHPAFAPDRHHAGRGRPAQQPLHPLRYLRRLPLPGPRQGRCRGHRRAPLLLHPNVTLW